jgi:hypothetical protein
MGESVCALEPESESESESEREREREREKGIEPLLIDARISWQY